MADQGAGLLNVEVAYGTPERQVVIALNVPEGCTLEQAIERSGIRDEFPELPESPAAVGIFGRKKPLDTVLQDGDRVEIYRPLLADPKEARRLRALAEKEQGSKGP